jgi:hypothetical protein
MRARGCSNCSRHHSWGNKYQRPRLFVSAQGKQHRCLACDLSVRAHWFWSCGSTPAALQLCIVGSFRLFLGVALSCTCASVVVVVRLVSPHFMMSVSGNYAFSH